jgi:hypothetical protein
MLNIFCYIILGASLCDEWIFTILTSFSILLVCINRKRDFIVVFPHMNIIYFEQIHPLYYSITLFVIASWLFPSLTSSDCLYFFWPILGERDYLNIIKYQLSFFFFILCVFVSAVRFLQIENSWILIFNAFEHFEFFFLLLFCCCARSTMWHLKKFYSISNVS